MKYIKLLLKHLFLFIIGGFAYYAAEMIYRNYSHFSMVIVGGLAFILIGLINEIMSWDTYLEEQVLIGVAWVLIVEFIAGCILNLWLKLNIWDYTNLPFNLLGQICLSYTLLWIPLVLIAILIDDFIRYIFFKEEKPRYKLAINKLIRRW